VVQSLSLESLEPDLDRPRPPFLAGLADLDLDLDMDLRRRDPRSRLRLLLRLRDLRLPPPNPRSRSRPPPPRPPRPPLRDWPLDISTRTLCPQTLVPSSPRTASSASLESSNSTNAKPGGFLATQTFFRGPYFEQASSSSYLEALFPKFPT